jgi:hypothetical protein
MYFLFILSADLMISFTPSHKRLLYPNHRKRGLANEQLLLGGFPYMILPRLSSLLDTRPGPQITGQKSVY